MNDFGWIEYIIFYEIFIFFSCCVVIKVRVFRGYDFFVRDGIVYIGVVCDEMDWVG